MFSSFVQWSKDGEHLFCKKGDTVSVISVSKGFTISSLGQTDGDVINCFTLDDNGTSLVIHYKSGLFKVWDWKGSNSDLYIYGSFKGSLFYFIPMYSFSA